MERGKHDELGRKVSESKRKGRLWANALNWLYDIEESHIGSFVKMSGHLSREFESQGKV